MRLLEQPNNVDYVCGYAAIRSGIPSYQESALVEQINKFVHSAGFQKFILALIVVSGILVGFETYPAFHEGTAIGNAIIFIQQIILWLFVAEPIVWVLLGLVDIGGVADYLPAATVLSIVDTEGDNLSYAGTLGMALVWTAVATAFAIWRTGRQDIT